MSDKDKTLIVLVAIVFLIILLFAIIQTNDILDGSETNPSDVLIFDLPEEQ